MLKIFITFEKKLSVKLKNTNKLTSEKLFTYFVNGVKIHPNIILIN